MRRLSLWLIVAAVLSVGGLAAGLDPDVVIRLIVRALGADADAL